MSTPTDFHAAATPAPDVVDYGTMNRELLAEKLRRAYWGTGGERQAYFTEGVHLESPANAKDLPGWFDVVDVAIAELQGTPNS